ncbi:protein phosphatase 2C [Gracilaria domingensis]|nr:protein phosphatase 2C [Gracilaria domingensis]
MLPALRNAVLDLDRSAIQATSAARIYAGSTLCALVRVYDLVYCVNVGDSRAVVIRPDDVKQLSMDHRCDLPRERHRIERAGGLIVGGMLNGYISMSRAIGDDDLKAHRNITRFPGMDAKPKRFGEELFIAEPDVECFSVDVSDLVCIIASDGVWNKLGNQQVMKLVRKQISKRMSAESIARHIVSKAISKGSKDNVTALVTFLWPYDQVYDALFSSRLRRSRRVYDPFTKLEDVSDGSVDTPTQRLNYDNVSEWRAFGSRSRFGRKPQVGRFAGMRGRFVDVWQSRSLSTLY